MEQEQELGEGGIYWMSGLPLGVWLVIAAVLAAVGFVLLVLSLAKMSYDADYRVRGWETRPRDSEEEWWKREYPESWEQVQREGGVNDY
jgi:hypothetical protein